MKKKAAERTAATPKTWARMLAKLTGDHKLQSAPRQVNNVDCCRAGLECRPDHVVGLFLAMVAEFRRNGGDVVRVKNGFALTEEQVKAANGYQVVLVNYRMVCETVTYADVVPHLEAIKEEVGWTPEDYFSPLLTWLQSPSVRDQPVSFLVETQTIIPVMLASRHLSHYPYKFVRCSGDERADAAAVVQALVDDLS